MLQRTAENEEAYQQSQNHVSGLSSFASLSTSLVTKTTTTTSNSAKTSRAKRRAAAIKEQVLAWANNNEDVFKICDKLWKILLNADEDEQTRKDAVKTQLFNKLKQYNGISKFLCTDELADTIVSFKFNPGELQRGRVQKGLGAQAFSIIQKKRC